MTTITLERKKKDKPKRDPEGTIERRRQRWFNRYNGDILQLDAKAIGGVTSEVKEQLAGLLGLGDEAFAKEVYRIVEEIHPEQLMAFNLQGHVEENILLIYNYYRFRDSLISGKRIRCSYTLADHRAVKFLDSLDDFYISKYVQNKGARSRMLNFLKTEHLEGRTANADKFARAFNRELKGISKANVENIVDTSVSRIRNWGHIRQLSENNMAIAQVSEIIDKITCDICREMDGKEFRVAYADAKVRELSDLTPEEFKRTAYDSAPGAWKENPVQYAKDHSVEEFIANDMVGPPWHGRCRGRLIIK